VQAAEDLAVAAILCPTQSGRTARRVAAFRPSMPVAGISPDVHVRGRMAVVWGVQAFDGMATGDPTTVDDDAVQAALDARLIEKGDLVVVVSGAPGRRAGATDHVRVVRA
jgi:pyruvate kinase